jgi:hypothetical protein
MDVQNVNIQGGNMSYYPAELFIFVLQVILRTTAVISDIVTNCTTNDTSINFPEDSFVLHYSHDRLQVCVKFYETFSGVLVE